MSLLDCIIKGVDQGIIPARKQTDMFDNFDARKKEYMEKGMSEAAAEKQAGLDTFDKIKFDKARKITIANIQAKKQAEFNYLLENSGMNPGEIMERIVAKMNVKEGLSEIRSAESAIEFFRALAQREFGKILVEFNQTISGGVKKKASQINLIKEIFQPGSTKNKATQELALAWIRTSELLRKLFNQRGGAISKMEGNYLPQFHDQTAVAAVDFTTWRNFLVENDLLDLERMVDYRTGKPFTPETLEFALRDVYETITQQGANKHTHHMGYGKAMYNKRMDHRFMHFKNADAWLAYNSKFGGDSSPFDIMVGHFETMTRDIGLMDRLGANPEAHLLFMKSQVNKWVQQQATKLPAKDFQKLQSKMNTHVYDAEASYMYLKGQLHAPVNQRMAISMAGLRGFQTMGKLGSAPVLALGDANFTRHAAAFAGLPQVTFMRRWLQGILTLPESEKRRIAATSSVIAESYMNVSSSSARFTADMTEQPEIMRRITDFSLKISGLNWMTQGGKNAAGLEFMAQLHTLPSKWDKLPKKFQEYLSLYNINKESWEIIKKTKPREPQPNAKFLDPVDILDRQDLTKEMALELSQNLTMALHRFVDFAVPSVNAKAATSGLIIGLGKTRSGTASGELMRMILQFKQFPMTFHHTHISRGLLRKNLSGKAKYLVPLIISTTLMGALAYELKQISKGKDISNVEKFKDPRYWINAMIHGGGLGYFGDLIFGTRYSAASGAAGVLGAAPGMIFDTSELIFDNLYEGLASDMEMNLGGDLAKYLRRHTPGGSHWYIRLALERLIFDTLQSMIDPKWNSKKRRKIKKTRKEQKTDFWWRPGDVSPNRPPSFF